MTKVEDRRVDDGLSARPVAEVDGQSVTLIGSMCSSCGNVAFPRRAVCLICGGEQLRLELSGAGTLYSWTHLANPPFGFAESMYYGCVDLDEGPRILCKVDGGRPRIGARVQARPDRVKQDAVGFSFRVSADA